MPITMRLSVEHLVSLRLTGPRNLPLPASDVATLLRLLDHYERIQVTYERWVRSNGNVSAREAITSIGEVLRGWKE
jgi:hydrogenase maturation factor